MELNNCGPLEGRIVFLEAKDPKQSYPGSREVIVVRETPNTWYAIPFAVGNHDCGNETAYTRSQYTVVNATTDWAAVRNHYHELLQFADTIKRGEPKRWVESVYTVAAAAARRLRIVLENNLQYYHTPEPANCDDADTRRRLGETQQRLTKLETDFKLFVSKVKNAATF